MIQRVQSLYMLLAALVTGVLSVVFPLYIYGDTMVTLKETFSSGNVYTIIAGVLFVLSTILSLMTIFLFKNRKLQINLNRINIVINFFLLGVIVYLLLTLSGETQVSEKGIGSFLPLVAVVLLSLANKAILKDERLVKSVDRLR